MDVRTVRESIAALSFGGGFSVAHTGRGLIDWRILTAQDIRSIGKYKAGGLPKPEVHEHVGGDFDVEFYDQGRWVINPQDERMWYTPSDNALNADLIRRIAKLDGTWSRVSIAKKDGTYVGWSLIFLPNA